MSVDIEMEEPPDDLQEAFAAAEAALGGRRVECGTAGELAAWMARLPAGTPVLIDETPRVDVRLADGIENGQFTTMATLVFDAAKAPGESSTAEAWRVGVRLNTVVVDGLGLPDDTLPLDAYGMALQGVEQRNLLVTLVGQAGVLRWMANTLSGQGGEPMSLLVDDVKLRAELAVEADRMRQAVHRLDALRERLQAVL
ncbi:hypothetical protein [Polymorphospora sp. NPDC050346]|uniref:hypothetical protein n=1 Tax=Polymorphospora sp. NPDC050346 TaxID=3155780 RepID=UPI00340B3FB9